MTPPRCGAPNTACAAASPMSAHPMTAAGTADVEARLLATDADALDQRLDAMAAAVCEKDPRTIDQRRADALGALGHGADRLACGCDDPDCEAAGTQPSTVVVHVITHEDSLSDDTPVQLDGQRRIRNHRQAAAGDDSARSPHPGPGDRRSSPPPHRRHCWAAGCCPPRCWPPRSRAPPRSCRSRTPATRRRSGGISRRRCWRGLCAAAI